MAALTLQQLRPCFEGIVPASLATCSRSGQANLAYLSKVYWVDPQHIALSRQFFNKTARCLAENPRSQLLVVHPDSFEQFRVDLVYLHTETQGSLFEDMRTELDTVASMFGMGDVFRLRGADVHRVLKIHAL